MGARFQTQVSLLVKAFVWGLGVQTQVLLLVKQVPRSLSRLLSP